MANLKTWLGPRGCVEAMEKGKLCVTDGNTTLISLSSVVTVPTALSTTKDIY